MTGLTSVSSSSFADQVCSLLTTDALSDTSSGST
jgi:hypothetical protein